MCADVIARFSCLQLYNLNKHNMQLLQYIDKAFVLAQELNSYSRKCVNLYSQEDSFFVGLFAWALFEVERGGWV